jgi:RNA polymerase sigma-70 factor, ECF subfamily
VARGNPGGATSVMTRAGLAGESIPLADLVEDEASFREWFDAVLPRVYRYILVRCDHDVAFAEELTQRTFEEAIRRRRQVVGRSDTMGWLRAIARAQLIEHLRQAGEEDRRRVRLLAVDADRRDANRRTGAERRAIEAALGTLPPRQRIALLLRHLDGLSARDVAIALGSSEAATTALLSDAREAFRRAYEGTSW